MCCAVLYCTLLYYTLLYYTILSYTTLHSTLNEAAMSLSFSSSPFHLLSVVTDMSPIIGKIRRISLDTDNKIECVRYGIKGIKRCEINKGDERR